jgi:hypothetical protein
LFSLLVCLLNSAAPSSQPVISIDNVPVVGLNVLGLETGRRGKTAGLFCPSPGALAGSYCIGRRSRTTPNPKNILFTTERDVYIVVSEPSGPRTFTAGSNSRILSVLRLDRATGFASIGVVSAVETGDRFTRQHEVFLSIGDLRRGASSALLWPLRLGRAMHSGQYPYNLIGAGPQTPLVWTSSTCHLGIVAVEDGRIVLGLDACPNPEVMREDATLSETMKQRVARWCFDEAKGWTRCSSSTRR